MSRELIMNAVLKNDGELLLKIKKAQSLMNELENIFSEIQLFEPSIEIQSVKETNSNSDDSGSK